MLYGTQGSGKWVSFLSVSLSLTCDERWLFLIVKRRRGIEDREKRCICHLFLVSVQGRIERVVSPFCQIIGN